MKVWRGNIVEFLKVVTAGRPSTDHDIFVLEKPFSLSGDGWTVFVKTGEGYLRKAFGFLLVCDEELL